MVIHTCNPGTQAAEAVGLSVQDQCGLHSKSLTSKKKKEGGGERERRGREGREGEGGKEGKEIRVVTISTHHTQS